MDSSQKTALAAAVAGGYLIGRTRKARTAIAIGTFVAGRRFGLTPAGLAAEGLRQLREHPQLAGLREQIRGELLGAVRAAASSSTDRGFSSLAGALRDRGRGQGRGRDEEEPEGADGQDAGDGEGDGGTADRPAPRRRTPEPARKKTAKKTAKKAAHGTPAGKPTTAKRTSPKKSAASAKRRTSDGTAADPSAARRGGKAEKTASGRSRATTNRRGR
ncbi:hypothetical protein RVR_266 [Actinacidiphila reveromycinica]|uniref:Histone protein n=1 Tax=Actinacidiphila reveromycinica TaxID=659352 RepID=A0A7U3UMR5_9ACTN|nr:hypothetical protein [Streptomyces sp. SN-593]BBA95421.1 hypothetical protein RVR_266 [Streptomyces sp. SN-593]